MRKINIVAFSRGLVIVGLGVVAAACVTPMSSSQIEEITTKNAYEMGEWAE